MDENIWCVGFRFGTAVPPSIFHHLFNDLIKVIHGKGKMTELGTKLVVATIVIMGKFDKVMVVLVGQEDQGGLVANRVPAHLSQAEETTVKVQRALDIAHANHGVGKSHGEILLSSYSVPMTLPDLTGKTVVITGASRGIGAALAESCTRRGMHVAGCARSLPSGCELAESVDVADAAAVVAFGEAAEQAFGRIDLWVNNAGVIDPVEAVRNMEQADFERSIAVNLHGVFAGSRFYARHLRAHGGPGVLINISSGAAWNGYAGWAAYCAGKAGVDRLTEVVQLEEAESGLRAHAVAPGLVDTYMQEQIRASSPEVFPDLDKFLEAKRNEDFNSLPYVVDNLLAIAFDPSHDTSEVLIRVAPEVRTA